MKKISMIAALMLLTTAAPVYAADNIAGTVASVTGDVSMHQSGSSAPITLKKGDKIFAGDEIETGKGAAITLHFADKAVLGMGADSGVKVTQYQFSGKTPKTVRLDTKGAFEWLGGDKETADTEIVTPHGTVAVDKARLVQGTAGGVGYVYAQDGGAVIRTAGGQVTLAAGSGTTIGAPGAKPSEPIGGIQKEMETIRATLPAPETPWPETAVQADPTCCGPEEQAVIEPPAAPAAPMDMPPVSNPEPLIAPEVPAEVMQAPAEIPAPAPLTEAPLTEAPAPAVTTPAPVEMPIPMPIPAPSQPAQ